jgi:hypothetical protein
MKKPQSKSKIENKVKKTNDSSTIRELSNSETLFQYLSDDSFRLFPEKDGWRKRLCYTLHLWSLKPESLEVQQFCDEYTITYSSLISMVSRYPDIALHYAEAKRRIGARRRIGALKNEFNTTAAFKDMNRYDPEWISLLKEHEDIKKDSGQNTRQVVIMEKFSELEDK